MYIIPLRLSHAQLITSIAGFALGPAYSGSHNTEHTRSCTDYTRPCTDNTLQCTDYTRPCAYYFGCARTILGRARINTHGRARIIHSRARRCFTGNLLYNPASSKAKLMATSQGRRKKESKTAKRSDGGGKMAFFLAIFVMIMALAGKYYVMKLSRRENQG